MQVFHPSLVVSEDVIHIHHPKKIGERPQDIVHHPHEICWCIYQTKWHDQPFKKTFFLLEVNITYICLLYWDLMVARIHINLTEVFGPLEITKDIFNSWNRVLVPECDFV